PDANLAPNGRFDSPFSDMIDGTWRRPGACTMMDETPEEDAMTGMLAAMLTLAGSIAAGPAPAGERDGEAAVANWSAPPFWTPARPAAGRRALSIASPPLPFFALPPCRLADTRGNGFGGSYGPPFMPGGVPRDFPISGQCGIPPAAQAVSFNLT